ncbi:MAG: phosphotransferase [Pseudomonadota bacterium]
MTLNPAQDDVWRTLILHTNGCTDPVKTESVQSLWSGFGEIFRVQAGGDRFIVKHVLPPIDNKHPRGWDSETGTCRKLRSYAVECHWYQHYSQHCTPECRVPKYFNAITSTQQSVLLLEDLDNAGYPLRYSSLDLDTALLCVDWLAHFHASFMDYSTEGLWPVGTYWHLDTRPDEYNVMAEGPLKQQAVKLDHTLRSCQYQSLVHGDAKVANFCFSAAGQVAAVDFQYIGGGCGMKDLAYLIGSCFDEDKCAAFEQQVLDRYFTTLAQAMNHSEKAADIEQEWRAMYPLAWTDFYRFLAGWMPDHKKIHRYTRHMADQAFSVLENYPDVESSA